MSTLVNYNPLDEIENTQKAVQALMKTPHYQKMGQDGVFAIYTKARSLGIDPFDALNGGLYFLSGKVGMSTEMMNSLIRQKGHSITKDPKSNNEVCILHGKRADNGDTWTVSFSLEDAKRAGLLKNMYEKYPQIMIFNRSLSILARQLFPDVIKGAGYCESELKEIADNKPIESPKLSLVTEEQVEMLNDMIGEDNEYRLKLMKHLKNQFNVENLSEIPCTLFERIFAGAKAANEKFMATVAYVDEIPIEGGEND